MKWEIQALPLFLKSGVAFLYVFCFLHEALKYKWHIQWDWNSIWLILREYEMEEPACFKQVYSLFKLPKPDVVLTFTHTIFVCFAAADGPSRTSGTCTCPVPPDSGLPSLHLAWCLTSNRPRTAWTDWAWAEPPWTCCTRPWDIPVWIADAGKHTTKKSIVVSL